MKKHQIHATVKGVIKEMEDSMLGGDGGQSGSSPSKPPAPMPASTPPAPEAPADDGVDVVSALKDFIDAVSTSPDGLQKLKDALGKLGGGDAPGAGAPPAGDAGMPGSSDADLDI